MLEVLLHLGLRRGVELIEALLLLRDRPVCCIDTLTDLRWKRVNLFFDIHIELRQLAVKLLDADIRRPLLDAHLLIGALSDGKCLDSLRTRLDIYRVALSDQLQATGTLLLEHRKVGCPYLSIQGLELRATLIKLLLDLCENSNLTDRDAALDGLILNADLPAFNALEGKRRKGENAPDRSHDEGTQRLTLGCTTIHEDILRKVGIIKTAEKSLNIDIRLRKQQKSQCTVDTFDSKKSTYARYSMLPAIMHSSINL